MSKHDHMYRIFDHSYRLTSGRSSSENKDMMDVLIKIPLAAKAETYRKNITWKDLIETKDILPTDIIHDIDFIEQKGGGFGWMSEEEPPIYYVPHILISRRRMETDEEYVKRLREIQAEKDLEVKKEKETYLRLHAKYGIGE